MTDHSDRPPHTAQRYEVANAVAGASVGVVVQAGRIDGGVQVTTGSVPGAETPRQLPVSGGLFVGRAAELDELGSLLRPPTAGQPRIVLLSGAAATGKTTLAVFWGHRAALHFPDGQLYVDLRGFGPDEPLSPLTVLSGFLRALGRSLAAESGPLEERAATFRTALSGRRVLVVLDNASSTDQVRPLLPGSATCAVVVTSRRKLSGLGVHHAVRTVALGVLGDAESRALLNAAIGERAAVEEESVGRLAAHCAGLPLALRIAAQRVAARPARSIASLVGELDGIGTGLDLFDADDDTRSTLRGVFSWSYRDLPAAVRGAFALLALHPGDTFDLPSATALLGTSGAEAVRLLRRLSDSHLVDDTGGDRFTMHDLLRSYGRELHTAADPPTHAPQTHVHPNPNPQPHPHPLGGLYDYYLSMADRAGRVIMPYRHRFALATGGRPIPVEPPMASRADALRWMDAEWRTLVALCRLDDPVFDVRRWQLAYTLRDYFYLAKHLDGWSESHYLALAGCARIGDRRAEAMTRNNLGRALLEAGRTAEAARQYRLAHDRFAELGDEHGLSDSLANLASLHRRQGAHTEALDLQLRALDVYRRTGATRKVGITLRSMAKTETELGRTADATGHATEATTLFSALGLDLDIAQSAYTLGLARQRGGDEVSATRAYEQAIEFGRRAGSRYEEARALRQLGFLDAAAGRVDAARDRWQASLELFTSLGAPDAGAVAAQLAGLGDGRPGSGDGRPGSGDGRPGSGDGRPGSIGGVLAQQVEDPVVQDPGDLLVPGADGLG
ncbi:ATP-binding protein [Streptomyces aurantiacus]|uniref:ATP-binding protein n=1 Tax=Streptomyces aurantiacus TaxID=47760 RepID=UPI0006E20F45|nr:tetratricopeptide repeat protein [Streptomyces aurantiacus]